MIRGILSLFILSCLLSLSLAQSKCTCQENAGESVYEDSNVLYPTPSLEEYSVDEMPDDGLDLMRMFNTINAEDYLANADTEEVNGYLTEANDKVMELQKQHDSLLDIKVGLSVEVDLMKKHLANLIGVELGVIVGTAKEPLVAIDLCLKVLVTRSKIRHLASVLAAIDVKLQANVELTGLWNKQIDALNNVLSLVDQINLGCLGLNLPILGDLTCNRLDILNTLTSPLVGILKSLCLNLDLSIKAYIAGIQVKVNANADVGLFTSRTSYDDVDDLYRDYLWSMYGLSEKQQAPTFEQSQEVVSFIANDLIHADGMKGYIIDLSLFVSLPWILNDDFEMVCTGLHDTSPNAVVKCTATGMLVKADIDAHIKIPGLISVNADVSLAVAAGKLTDSLRCFFLASTGCLSVETQLLSCNEETGLISINIFLDKYEHDLKSRLYDVGEYSSEIVPGGLDHDVVTNSVNEQTLNTLNKLDTATTPEQLETVLQECRAQMAESVKSIEDGTPAVAEAVKANKDASETLEKQNEAKAETLQTTTNVEEQAEIVKNVVVGCRNQDIEDYRTLLDTYRLAVDQAETQVALCEQNLIQNKMNVLSDPENAQKVAAYESSHKAYMDQYKSALRISTQYKALCDLLDVYISAHVDGLVSVEAQLGVNIDSLLSDVTKAIETIRVYVALNENQIKALFTLVLKALRLSIIDLDISFVNLDYVGDQVIDILVNIIDQGKEGEDEYQMRQCHENLIQKVMQVVIGTKEIVCEALSLDELLPGLPGIKRTTNTQQYKATIGSAPPPETSTTSPEPTDVPVTTPEDPNTTTNEQPKSEVTSGTISDDTDYAADEKSSASSLSFSIITLIGIVLCFF